MENSNDKEQKTKTRGNQFAIIVSNPSENPPGNNCLPPGDDNCEAKNESKQDVKDSTPVSHYSLRSQLKRPINSEADQSREPLTKKPAKGLRTSSAKLTQGFQKRMKPQDESFTSEIALNVDLIAKSLFRYMDCITLKSCRLVCRKWKYFGAKELQRRRHVVSPQLSFGHVIDKSKKSVRSLLTVMKNSEANTFPCASFNVATEELSSPRIKNFFRVAEARNLIKKLSLTLNYEKKKLPLKESTLLDDFRDVLLRHMSNIEALQIIVRLPSHWEDGLNTWDHGSLHLENSPCLLRKLTYLDLSGSLIPKKLFEDVMNAAVNLQTYTGSRFSPELLEYFVEGNGRHRIHLLKHLSFYLLGAFIEVMERLMVQHGDNLKLKTFDFRHFCERLNNEADYEFLPKASIIISQLLNSSASTIKVLGISLMRFLPGLVIPRLPELRRLRLVDNFCEDDIDNNYFFPFEFSLANSFPNLVYIILVSGSVLRSIEMLSITGPVASVKHIYWRGEPAAISDDTRGRLHAAFPFAALHYSY